MTEAKSTLKVGQKCVDYASWRAYETMTALGVKCVGRYISTSSTVDGQPVYTWKSLTPAEVAELHLRGIGIIAFWEEAAADPLQGMLKGAAHGTQAARSLAVLGYPAGLPCIAAIDVNTTAVNIDACADYMKGFKAGLGSRWVCGVYGDVDIIRRCAADGSASVFHFAGAASWSHGETSELVHLKQTVGATYDTNAVLRDIEMWLPVSTALYPFGYTGNPQGMGQMLTMPDMMKRATVLKLHPEFRRRMFALMRYCRANGHPLGVGTGWRSYAQQAALHVTNPSGSAAPGNSNHEGNNADDDRDAIAADMVPNLSWTFMHSALPQFGLISFLASTNPADWSIQGRSYTTAGTQEPWHIQPQEVSYARAGRKVRAVLKDWPIDPQWLTDIPADVVVPDPPPPPPPGSHPVSSRQEITVPLLSAPTRWHDTDTEPGRMAAGQQYRVDMVGPSDVSVNLTVSGTTGAGFLTAAGVPGVGGQTSAVTWDHAGATSTGHYDGHLPDGGLYLTFGGSGGRVYVDICGQS